MRTAAQIKEVKAEFKKFLAGFFRERVGRKSKQSRQSRLRELRHLQERRTLPLDR